MKFFQAMDPLFIDVERSIKIENIDLVYTFTKVIIIYFR